MTVTGGINSANDTLSISGVSNGAGTLGGNAYISASGAVAAATAVVTLGNANRTITVTVGSSCVGAGCGAIGTQSVAGTYSYVAATTLTDVAGNLPSVVAKTQSIRMW